MNYRPYPSDPSSEAACGSKDNAMFPEETIDALQELGMIFRRTHERMVAEGYTIVNGKVVKLTSSQNDDNDRS